MIVKYYSNKTLNIRGCGDLFLRREFVNKCFFLLLLHLTIYSKGFAQNSLKDKITWSGFSELYYSYDFSNPANHVKEPFIYNFKRHNELNCNILMAKVNLTDDFVRSNVGVMTGNYAQYNMSQEPNWAQFIFEANIGVKLLQNSNLWFDAGVFPSHIGFESAISSDCWSLTRSVLAENSPYFETGARLSYTTVNDKLYLSAMYLNGWQRITKKDGMQNPSFGMQITYKPNSKFVFNYSNFLGSDLPDSLNSFRHFHNFYWQLNTINGFGVVVGFDIGNEMMGSRNMGCWYAPIVVVRKELNKSNKLSLRSEMYSDKNNLIISNLNSFEIFGVSTNFDHFFNDNTCIRVEAKMLFSENNIFQDNCNKNYSITSNLAIKF